MQKKQANLYVPAILSSLLLIVFAVCVFPIPGTDSLVFLPPAISYAHGQGFTNPLYYVDKFTDPTHTHRFNYYVPLFPWLVGAVGRAYSDVRTIFLFCAMLGTGGLMLYTRKFVTMASDASRHLRLGFIFSCFYLPIFFLPTVSRPENLTFFVSFIIYLIYGAKKRIPPVAYHIAIALLFASLLASQILCFFFCFVFYALCDVIETDKPIRSALESLAVFILSIGFACLIIAAGPIGFRETLDAVWWHVSAVVKRNDNSLSLLFYYWALAPLSFGFIGIFLLAAGFFIRSAFARLRQAKPLTILFAAFLAFILIWALFRYVLYGAPTVYNVTQFVLPFMSFIIVSLAKTRNKIMTIAFGLLCVAGTFAMSRHILLFGNMLASGKTFSAARAIVLEKTGKNQNVYVSNGVWPLYPDIYAPAVHIGDQFSSGDTIVLQQAYLDIPEELKNRSEVIFDWRAAEPVRVLGLKVASRPQGYGFSILRVK
ncbi:MAG: hypothetical protein KF744_07290 [Taibaiella sp.]|nr:hypothetical protein [Taibaiella sp.]